MNCLDDLLLWLSIIIPNSLTAKNMTKIETPSYLKDASQLLTADGFKIGECWYHGTTSGLADVILEQGLKGSGDAELSKMTKKAMATIGNSYTERKEPVYLTQSKELAYYWACQKVMARKHHFAIDESAVVLAVSLSEDLNTNVKTDVGAATMLLEDKNAYIEYLREIYNDEKLFLPELDPSKVDRMDYLNRLGLAYFIKDISSENVQILEE